jgi:hypothetical protein
VSGERETLVFLVDIIEAADSERPVMRFLSSLRCWEAIWEVGENSGEDSTMSLKLTTLALMLETLPSVSSFEPQVSAWTRSLQHSDEFLLSTMWFTSYTATGAGLESCCFSFTCRRDGTHNLLWWYHMALDR